MKQADLYNWSANISAPKFYPASYISVDFVKTGAAAGVLTGIDPGWGETIGNFLTGSEYKPVPQEVYIRYSSGENNFIYEGIVQLPKEKIRSIFREQSHPKHVTNTKKKEIQIFNQKEENDNTIENTFPKVSAYFELIVGMAPGGWIRVWIRGDGDFDKVQIMKARLKGHYDDTANERYKIKNIDNWGKYYIYWQHHGVPYEAWATNEKEYDYGFKFVSKNKEAKLDRSYVVSSDGWYSSFYTEKLLEDINDVSKGYEGKIPVHLSISWQDKQSGKYYDTNIVMPKSLKKIFEETYIADKKYTYSNFIVELENDKKYAIVYLKTRDKTIKLLRFKGKLSSKEKQDFGDYAYATDIEYFIK